MKGCAFKALLSILALVALAGALSFGLDQFYGLTPRDTVLASVLGGIGAWVAANLLISAITSWRERTELIDGLGGKTPVDGRRAVLVGELRPAGGTVVAPFSGSDCVAYSYEIYRMQRQPKGRSIKVTHYDGVALVPSVIVTRAGSFVLAAVPELECEETVVASDAERQRAADFIARTTFEMSIPLSARPSIERQWNDNDGSFRRDSQRVTDEVVLAECTLTEKRIAPGVQVCVIGRYSADRRAIVADPNDWSKITRLITGNVETVTAHLRSRAIGWLVAGVIVTAMVAGGLAAFVSSSS